MPFSVRSACVKAVTLSGTSWSRSLRRVAVTTMSAGLVAESVLFAVAASAGRLSSAGAGLGWGGGGGGATNKATQEEGQGKRGITPPRGGRGFWKTASREGGGVGKRGSRRVDSGGGRILK